MRNFDQYASETSFIDLRSLIQSTTTIEMAVHKSCALIRLKFPHQITKEITNCRKSNLLEKRRNSRFQLTYSFYKIEHLVDIFTFKDATKVLYFVFFLWHLSRLANSGICGLCLVLYAFLLFEGKTVRCEGICLTTTGSATIFCSFQTKRTWQILTIRVNVR